MFDRFAAAAFSSRPVASRSLRSFGFCFVSLENVIRITARSHGVPGAKKPWTTPYVRQEPVAHAPLTPSFATSTRHSLAVISPRTPRSLFVLLVLRPGCSRRTLHIRNCRGAGWFGGVEGLDEMKGESGKGEYILSPVLIISALKRPLTVQ